MIEPANPVAERGASAVRATDGEPADELAAKTLRSGPMADSAGAELATARGMRGIRSQRRIGRPSGLRTAERASRLIDRLIGLLAGVLVVFHSQLLWTHFVTGRLLEPATAIRWAIAALLLVALILLRRVGVPLIWSRQASVFWLLVALLHCGTALPGADGASAPWADPALLVIVPSATVVALSSAATSRLAGRRRSTTPILPATLERLGLVPARSAFALSPGFITAYAARPPPSRVSSRHSSPAIGC